MLIRYLKLERKMVKLFPLLLLIVSAGVTAEKPSWAGKGKPSSEEMQNGIGLKVGIECENKNDACKERLKAQQEAKIEERKRAKEFEKERRKKEIEAKKQALKKERELRKQSAERRKEQAKRNKEMSERNKEQEKERLEQLLEQQKAGDE